MYTQEENSILNLKLENTNCVKDIEDLKDVEYATSEKKHKCIENYENDCEDKNTNEIIIEVEKQDEDEVDIDIKIEDETKNEIKKENEKQNEYIIEDNKKQHTYLCNYIINNLLNYYSLETIYKIIDYLSFFEELGVNEEVLRVILYSIPHNYSQISNSIPKNKSNKESKLIQHTSSTIIVYDEDDFFPIQLIQPTQYTQLVEVVDEEKGKNKLENNLEICSFDDEKEQNIEEIKKQKKEEQLRKKKERELLKLGQPLPLLLNEDMPFEIIKENGYTYYLYDGEERNEKWKKYIQLVKHSNRPSEFGKLTIENLEKLLIMSRAANFYHYDWMFETDTGKVFVETRTEEWYFYPFADDRQKELWHKNRNFNSGYHFQRKDTCSAEEHIRFFHFHECEKFRVKFLGDVAKEKSCKGDYKEYRPNSFKRRKGKYRASKIKI